MASGKGFSHTVTLNGMTKHIYGAPIATLGNWYFVRSMPKGATDALLDAQNILKLKGFGIAGVSIFLLFFIVFIIYLHDAIACDRTRLRPLICFLWICVCRFWTATRRP